MNHTVEILLATYNGEKYLSQQIDSILAQSVDRWHLTISDDGSTDSTLTIIADYVQRYPNKIHRICSGKRFGNAREHFFWLMDHCEAEHILTCDQDDRWYPDKISRMLEEMVKAESRYGHEMPLLVFSDQIPTDAELKPLAPSLMRYQDHFFESFDYRSILMQNVVTGGAMCINRALADLAMKCKDTSQTIMHDWWMATVAARFGKIIYIDEPLSDYRQHGENSVGAKNVHSLTHVVHKMMNLQEVQRTIASKKRQAYVFADTYENCLEDEDHAFLEQFAKTKSGPAFYWQNRALIHGFFRLAGMMVLG